MILRRENQGENVGLKQEFILVLLRLRLGLMERHLADMFAVSVSTVGRIYMTWVRFLALTFKVSLLHWTSKEEIKTHIPNSFSKYPGTCVIIERTEFFIEKPSSPSAQKATLLSLECEFLSSFSRIYFLSDPHSLKGRQSIPSAGGGVLSIVDYTVEVN